MMSLMTDTATGQTNQRDIDQAVAELRGPQTAAACLTELMRRIEIIRKEREVSVGEKYQFRGVDDVMNSVGPNLRALDLLCIPELVWQETAQVEYGSRRSLGFRTRVQVRYRLIGPDGSQLEVGPVLGESIDSGDKGGAKAQSVAYREMWLRTLCVPTGERDPDEDQFKLAKPEASISDPEVVAKLEQRIRDADSEAKLRNAFSAITAEYEGEKATITKADADRLTDLVKARKVEVMGE
jgi:hypothetical protein